MKYIYIIYWWQW